MDTITPTKRVGSKTHLARWITANLPPHNTYIEGFGGTGAVLLDKPRSGREVYNDLDGSLCNLFAVIRDQSEQLAHALSLTLYSRREYEEACEYIESNRGPTDNPVEWARRYVICTRQSFIGGGGNTWSITRAGHPLSRTWANLPEAVVKLASRLKGVAVENADYRQLVRRWDAEDTTFYLDPPYYGIEKAYYSANRQDGFDHKALRECIETVKGSVVVSYYAHEDVSRLYAGFETVQRPSRNQIGTVRRPVTEVLFIRCSPWARERRRAGRFIDIFPDDVASAS